MAIRRARAWRVIAAGALSLASAGFAQAADVFVSAAPDGSLRYATQALDASYSLAYRELSTAIPSSAQAVPHTKPNARLDRLRPVIERVAHRHGLSPALVEAVVVVESNSDPAAVSQKGAQGAMQLMPATGARYGLTGAQAWRDPERNIDAGVRHLKDLLARYHGNVPLALAAYNAGVGAVLRHGKRIPPYPETMLYVPAVLTRSLPEQRP